MGPGTSDSTGKRLPVMSGIDNATAQEGHPVPDIKQETITESTEPHQDFANKSIDDTIAALSLNPQPSAGMFRALATIFQASQMHEGAFEPIKDATAQDLWTSLQQAAKLETENVQDVPSLVVVRDVLEQLHRRTSKLIQPSLRILADASREEKWRVPLGDGGIVDFCLGVIASTVTANDTRIQCLRLVGNSCADTDENRERVVSSPHFATLVESLKVSEIASVAVPAFYNVCCDFEPASKEAVRIGLYEVLIQLVDTGVLEGSPAFSYLCRLFDVGLEHLDATKSPWNSVELLLKCATKPGLETEDSVSLVDAAVAHLQLNSFQQHMVNEDLVGVPLRFIIRSYFPKATLTGSGIPALGTTLPPSRDADDEAELSRVRKSLIQALSDVSALPEFAEKHSSLETPLVESLTAWITAALPHVQLCACIILGNLARDDHVCISMLTQTNIHKDLISVLRASNDTQVLHSSLSFLRNLALPAQNKERLGQCGIVDALVKFWTSTFMPQVAHTAVAVARQLVIGTLSNVERFMAPLSNDPDSPAIARTHVSLLLSLFDRTDEVVVKMEVARTVAGILRCIYSGMESPSARSDALHRLFSHHTAIGEPLGMMVAQTQYPVIRSEGWFALALMARDTDGAALLGAVVAKVDVYSALEAAVGAESAAAEPPSSVMPLNDTEHLESTEAPAQTDDMKAKDRDNALILINGLLQQQSPDLLSTIRRSALEELLQTGIQD